MVLCSTPFGINGSVTSVSRPGHRSPPDVLNAFRHQRIGHTTVIAAIEALRGAQRLSASTDRSSWDWSCCCRCGVLNAFRHQRIGHRWLRTACFVIARCSTPFGINGSVTARGMATLASDAKCSRLSASTDRSPDGALPSGPTRSCSTPFGINGSVTGTWASSAAWLSLCSTPFGINGSVTR